MALPAAVQYGTVVWQAVAAVADGADADGQPDAIPVTGKVTFTPSTNVLLAPGGSPVTVMATPVTYDLDGDGVLRDSQGRVGVTLVATDSPSVTPIGWTWNVSYRLNPVQGQSVSRGSFSFALPAGTTIDLTSVGPVTTSNGVPITQGPKGDPGSAYPLASGDAGDVAIAALVDSSSSATGDALRAAFPPRLQAFPDEHGADPTGTADSTTAVLAAIADLDARGAHRGEIVFGPGVYKFGGIVLGALALGQGKNYCFRGQGETRTELRARAANEIMLEFRGSNDSSGDFSILEDLTLGMHIDRADYATPILKFTCCRNLKLTRVGMQHNGNHMGTFVVLDSAYSVVWRDSAMIVGKYGVPVEITNVTPNPFTGAVDQVDTWIFDGCVHSGCGPIIAKKDASTEAHGLRFRNHKTAISTFYPTNNIGAPSTINGAVSAGATTITMNDASTYVAGDAVTVGVGASLEFNRVRSVAGQVLTLWFPLRFAQADKQPVIRGGAAIATDRISLFKVEDAHFEFNWCAVLLGAGSVATFDHILTSCANLVATIGTVNGLHIGAMLMAGSSVGNNLIFSPNSSWGPVFAAGSVELAGPFQKLSGAAFNPSITPISGTNANTGPINSWAPLDSSIGGSNVQHRQHSPDIATRGADKLRRFTYGSAITEVAYEQAAGRAWWSDGIATKDVGDITAKTSAQIDAVFAVTPVDGLLATGVRSGVPVALERRNGKWNYINLNVIA